MKGENEYSLVFQCEQFDSVESEYKDGDWNCYFLNGKKKISFRRTKTLVAANLSKGKKYILRTDSYGNPIYVKGNGIEITRQGNKIVEHDLKTDRYFNLTAGVEVDPKFKPLNNEKIADGRANYNMAALNKFNRGDLNEELLKKMNKKGVHFTIHSYESKGNSFGNFSAGMTYTGKKNTVVIEKYKKVSIDEMVQKIKNHYLKNGLEKHFEITTQLLKAKPAKKRKIQR